jgi:hypothetical protein
MQYPVSTLSSGNIQMPEAISKIIATRTHVSCARVSMPDLLFGPLPGLGLLAPEEDCLVVWIGCQTCG